MIKQLNEEVYNQIIDILLDVFDDDYDRIFMWLNIRNPVLDHKSPLDLIHAGREEKLLKQLVEATKEVPKKKKRKSKPY